MNAAVPVLGKGHVARNFIGGEWRLPRHGYEIDVYAPTSIEELGSVPRSAAADADDALDRASAALRHDIGAIVRARAVSFCETVRARAAEIARVEHLDSGAPLEFAARTVHASASWMEEMLPRERGGADVAACGCSAWILPSYAPFWLYCSQVFEALLAGHAVVLKPSSTTPLTAVCFAEMIADLDLPAGCFAVLQGTGRDAGTALARSPKVDRLGFVGGRDAARMVTRSAAEPLTACTISTGNLNPSVLLADGDLDSLVRNLAASLFAHGGQGGFSSRWVLAPEERLADVLAALERGLDALDASGGAGTSVAPLVSEDRRVRVVRFLTALERYAPESTIGTVQRPPAFPMGYFLSPSVVVDPSPNDLIRGADLPGPVLFVSPYRSENDLASALLDLRGSGRSACTPCGAPRRCRQCSRARVAPYESTTAAPRAPAPPNPCGAASTRVEAASSVAEGEEAMSKLSGGCACGQVRYSAEGPPALVANCHCRDCQRAGGGQMSTVVAVGKAGFEISGGPKGYGYTGDSGAKLTRYFCPTCGSRLYTDADAMADLAILQAGSLDDASDCRPMMNIYCASAQPWAAMDDALPKFDGMPG